jgi:hypothetical protein
MKSPGIAATTARLIELRPGGCQSLAQKEKSMSYYCKRKAYLLRLARRNRSLVRSINIHRRFVLIVVIALALPLALFGAQAKAHIALASPGSLECMEMHMEMEVGTDPHSGADVHCPPPPESGVRNGGGPGSLVAYNITETGEEQYYTNDGQKLAGIAFDDLKIFASAPAGTTISFTAADGKIITLAYQSNGLFTGTYNGGVFSFTQSDVETYTQCSLSALALAQSRVNALLTGIEKSIAQAILNAVDAACP